MVFAGLAESQLEELAFQLFVNTCGSGPQAAPLLHTVRTRLQVHLDTADIEKPLKPASAGLWILELTTH